MYKKLFYNEQLYFFTACATRCPIFHTITQKQNHKTLIYIATVIFSAAHLPQRFFLFLQNFSKEGK